MSGQNSHASCHRTVLLQGSRTSVTSGRLPLLCPSAKSLVLPRNPTECPTEACIHEWQRRDDFIVETQPKVEPFPGYRLRAVDEDGRVALRLSFGEHELARASVDVHASEFDGRLSCPDFRAVVRAMVGKAIAP